MNWEFYGDIVMHGGSALEICISALLFRYFVKPFLMKEERSWIVAAVYGLTMLALKFFPGDIDSRICYGIGVTVVFSVMYRLDHRNPEQKIFLAVTFYLLEWISWGMILGPWDLLYQSLVRSPFAENREWLLFLIWLFMESLFVAMNAGAKALLIWVIHSVYHCKRENITGREFALLMAPSLSVITGYWIISYFCNIYGMDSGQYIDDVHNEYIWFRALYMAVSFAALLTVIISYQRIKDGQRREKEDVVLLRQMEDMKRHVEEVEQLYFDIRSLKHDMANHMMLLEELCGKSNQYQREAAEYMARLKQQAGRSILEIKSGNPVTDVILREKSRRAEEKGIFFQADFRYPPETRVEAFDVSILLNNGLNNAIEAAQGCREACVSIRSWCRKNAWMIEIRNSFEGRLTPDGESGLPATTKKEPGHGFGLANIRKVARKYQGDMDISQDGEEVVLCIMLMIS